MSQLCGLPTSRSEAVATSRPPAPGRDDVDGASRPADDPASRMSAVLDRPPPVIPTILRDGTLLTKRWVHGELHDRLDPMSCHVVMTFYPGVAQHVLWREGREQLSTRTHMGAVTIVPEGHEGRWDIAGPIEVSHVYLSDERLKAASESVYGDKSLELVNRVIFDDPVTAHVLALLSEEAETGDGTTRLLREQAVDLLCTQLVRGHSSLSSLTPAERPRGLAEWQVKKVTDYMQEFIDREIGVQELADLVGLSRFHFSAAFRKATRQSPFAWLTQLRMSRARELLHQPALSVTDIGLEVGYQTPSAFTAAFRKSTGLTPTEYRRLL